MPHCPATGCRHTGTQSARWCAGRCLHGDAWGRAGIKGGGLKGTAWPTLRVRLHARVHDQRSQPASQPPSSTRHTLLLDGTDSNQKRTKVHFHGLHVAQPNDDPRQGGAEEHVPHCEGHGVGEACERPSKGRRKGRELVAATQDGSGAGSKRRERGAEAAGNRTWRHPTIRMAHVCSP